MLYTPKTAANKRAASKYTHREYVWPGGIVDPALRGLISAADEAQIAIEAHPLQETGGQGFGPESFDQSTIEWAFRSGDVIIVHSGGMTAGAALTAQRALKTERAIAARQRRGFTFAYVATTADHREEWLRQVRLWARPSAKIITTTQSNHREAA